MLFVISNKHSILLSRVFVILRVSTANDTHLYEFKQKFNKKLGVILIPESFINEIIINIEQAKWTNRQIFY